MTDASATAIRDARIAWIVGGSLLVASAIVTSAGGFPSSSIPGMAIASDLLWLAALAIFAVGIRGSGSVVARQPLGVVALFVAGALPLVARLPRWFLPVETMPTWVLIMVSQGRLILSLAALLIAAVIIGRAGAVPAKVRWVPLIILIVVAVTQIIPLVVVGTASGLDALRALPLMLFATVVSTAAPIVLGVLAIASRPPVAVTAQAHRSVQVYPPAG